MSDLGGIAPTGPAGPSPESSPPSATGGAPQREEDRPEFAEKEVPLHADAQTELERARAFGEELMSRGLADEVRRTPGTDSDQLASLTKDLAVLMLAKISVPGNVELHEAVFKMAHRLVEEQRRVSTRNS
ncbi:MAG: hypothetical protein ACRDIB_17250 [Ardenticatenaceae bacterium]